MIDTFTEDAAKAARSVHNWTRFAALVTGTTGAVSLLATLIGAGVAAARLPQYRGLIVGIGTLYAASAMAMLCFAFLLARYGEKLLLAAKQRSARPLLDALPYETGIWSIVAAYVVMSVLSSVLSVASPVARSYVTGQPGAQTAPIVVEDPEAFLRAINRVSAVFAAIGLVLVIGALKPVRE